MRIGFKGQLLDEPRVRVAFIGCGSHAFRNLYPCLQFVPAELVAVCDLRIEKARAFATAFGAKGVYDDHKRMLSEEAPDAVFLCLGYDAKGRPLYPAVAADCLRAGCHVWMEKPPAATCQELADLRAIAAHAGKHVMVGFKKMFAPANEKARELMASEGFGQTQMAMLRYPVYVPTADDWRTYAAGNRSEAVVGFLDHICHPVSLMLMLLGMPSTLYYRRSAAGAGAATFGFASGVVATLAMSHGASINGGLEHTVIISDAGRHITVENNTRVTLYRLPPLGYGDEPNFYAGAPGEAASLWEPEFSLGQLYNKGIFLLGYYNEIHAFVRAVLDGVPPAKGTLEHALQATHIYEAFAQGPNREIALDAAANSQRA